MKHLYQALIKAQQEFGPILKNATNPHFQSRYADLSGVIESVIEHLHTNGILLLQPTDVTEGEIIVRTQLIHAESGEILESAYKVICKDPTDPQKVGGGLSYARRYALLSLLGLAPEDDDGNTASAPVTPARATRVSQESHEEDQPCQYPDCDQCCGANFVDYSKRTYGKVYCRKHMAMAKRGELSDPKENLQTMSIEEEMGKLPFD